MSQGVIIVCWISAILGICCLIGIAFLTKTFFSLRKRIDSLERVD